jgi:hypothetical protein
MTIYKDYRLIIVKREIYSVGKNAEPLTVAWRDWGFRLNLKMVLYLENLCLTEKPHIFNPKPRVAPKRYRAVEPKLRRQIQFENKHLFPPQVSKTEA